jgi:hypothetical protein
MLKSFPGKQSRLVAFHYQTRLPRARLGFLGDNQAREPMTSNKSTPIGPAATHDALPLKAAQFSISPRTAIFCPI